MTGYLPYILVVTLSCSFRRHSRHLRSSYLSCFRTHAKCVLLRVWLTISRTAAPHCRRSNQGHVRDKSPLRSVGRLRTSTHQHLARAPRRRRERQRRYNVRTQYVHFPCTPFSASTCIAKLWRTASDARHARIRFRPLLRWPMIERTKQCREYGNTCAKNVDLIDAGDGGRGQSRGADWP